MSIFGLLGIGLENQPEALAGQARPRWLTKSAVSSGSASSGGRFEIIVNRIDRLCAQRHAAPAPRLARAGDLLRSRSTSSTSSATSSQTRMPDEYSVSSIARSRSASGQPFRLPGGVAQATGQLPARRSIAAYTDRPRSGERLRWIRAQHARRVRYWQNDFNAAVLRATVDAAYSRSFMKERYRSR